MINISTAGSPLVSIITGMVHIIDTNTILSEDLREAQKLQKYSKMSRNCPSVDLHPVVTSEAIVLALDPHIHGQSHQLRGKILSA